MDGYTDKWAQDNDIDLPQLKDDSYYTISYDDEKYTPPDKNAEYARRPSIEKTLQKIKRKDFNYMLNILDLSQRERKIMRLLCIQGKSQKEIATLIGVSPPRICTIIKTIGKRARKKLEH